MKIKATEKFSKLGSANNWAGFGKETYIQLESGKEVNVNSVDDALIEGGYVKQSTKTKKSDS